MVSVAKPAATPSSSSSPAEPAYSKSVKPTLRLWARSGLVGARRRSIAMHTWWKARPADISIVLTVFAMAGAVLAPVPLAAQTPGQAWPTKRVQIAVPCAPGSATDLLPRTIFEHVSAKVGQPFIVENRPGGGGAMGVSAVAKAEPDGHTLLVHSNALVTSPAIQSMPY